VLEGGRIKPLESVARAHLLIFHGKQSVRTDAGRVSAMEWLTEVLFNREAAKGMRVFRIDDPDIISMFGVEPGTKNQFSYRELEPYLARIQEQARLVDPDSKQRSPYERSIIRLFNNLIQYQMLTQTVYPLEIADRVPSYYQGLVSSLSQSPESMQPGGGMSPQMGMLRIHMRQLESMAQSPLFLVHGGEQWVTPGDWLRSSIPETGALAEPLRIIAEMAQARQSGDAESFREAGMRLASLTPDPADARPGMEFYFKQSQPFIVALGLYVLVALLVFLGWLFSPALFLGPAFGILLAGLGVHTFGLILRVFITGYAPVTNLYSSAVFTGWVAVVLSVFFERSQKQGIGSLAAAVVGFLSLLVAHHLSSSGDTMEKMRAVLNSNFWLTTHVITIIMGYGATFLAGFLGLFLAAVQLHRDGAGRHLGRPVVGPLLGLGSEGERRPDAGALDGSGHPRAALRDDPHPRPGEPGHWRQHHHRMVMVRHQHAGRRPAFLRVHGQRLFLAGVVLDFPAAVHRRRGPVPGPGKKGLGDGKKRCPRGLGHPIIGRANSHDQRQFQSRVLPGNPEHLPRQDRLPPGARRQQRVHPNGASRLRALSLHADLP